MTHEEPEIESDKRNGWRNALLFLLGVLGMLILAFRPMFFHLVPNSVRILGLGVLGVLIYLPIVDSIAPGPIIRSLKLSIFCQAIFVTEWLIALAIIISDRYYHLALNFSLVMSWVVTPAASALLAAILFLNMRSRTDWISELGRFVEEFFLLLVCYVIETVMFLVMFCNAAT